MPHIQAYLIIMAISIKGMCNGDKSTANEFLNSKWKMWYKSLDVNHDGKVSAEDAKASGNTFSDLKRLDITQRKMVNINFKQWWDKCVFRWGKEPIFEQGFVDSLKANFIADMGEFVEEMGKCFQLIFSTADINEDKSISEEELLVAFAAYGHRQIAKDKDYFSAYNSTDGLVPLNVVVDSWVDFVTSTDESKGNIVANRFTIDGFQ